MEHRSKMIWTLTVVALSCVACASRPPEAALPTSTSTFATIVSTVQTRPTVTVTLPPRPAVTTTVVQTQQAAASGSYTIRDGDLLGALAIRFGVSEQAILDANGLSNPDLLFAGRTIVIPGVDTSAQSTVTATTALAAPTTVVAATTGTAGTYVIQDGDLLGALAIRFGVSEQAILDANGLSNPDLLFAGRTINIPSPG